MKLALLLASGFGASWAISLEALEYVGYGQPGQTPNFSPILPDRGRGHERGHEREHEHGHESERGRGGMPWPVLEPVSSLSTKSMQGRWHGVMSNLITFSMNDGPLRCMTKDINYAENEQSLQILATTDVVMPDTGVSKRMKLGGRWVLPFNDGRIHASMNLMSARRFPDEANLMVVRRQKEERRELNREYDYMILTDPTANFLMVLARNVEEFENNDMQDVIDYLEATKFTDPWNRPVLINHTDCQYSEMMQPSVPQEMYSEAKMQGRWFQMIGNFFLSYYSPFEKRVKCVTIDLIRGENPGMLSIVGTKQDIDTGKIDSEEGELYQAHEDAPSIYKYMPSSSPGANYWVLAVGPMNEEKDQYEWAIVSDPLSLSLWVLARDTNVFNNKYKTEILAILEQRGFNKWWNKAVYIDHSGCQYTPQPKPIQRGPFAY